MVRYKSFRSRQWHFQTKFNREKRNAEWFGIAHGGITYCLADSALAFSSNSHGKKSVSVETSISHLISLSEGDELIAEAKEEHCSNKIGTYTITVKRVADSAVVALFKGTVYRTSKDW